MPANVLLVEDETALRMTMGDRLRNEGYVVDYAVNGDEGFEKATGLPFDLILLDVLLPYRNGFVVCHDIREAGLITPSDVDRLGTDRGQSARPQDRRRRLRHEAVRDAGTDGPGGGAAPPRAQQILGARAAFTGSGR